MFYFKFCLTGWFLFLQLIALRPIYTEEEQNILDCYQGLKKHIASHDELKKTSSSHDKKIFFESSKWKDYEKSYNDLIDKCAETIISQESKEGVIVLSVQNIESLVLLQGTYHGMLFWLIEKGSSDFEQILNFYDAKIGGFPEGFPRFNYFYESFRENTITTGVLGLSKNLKLDRLKEECDLIIVGIATAYFDKYSSLNDKSLKGEAIEELFLFSSKIAWGIMQAKTKEGKKVFSDEENWRLLMFAVAILVDERSQFVHVNSDDYQEKLGHFITLLNDVRKYIKTPEERDLTNFYELLEKMYAFQYSYVNFCEKNDKYSSINLDKCETLNNAIANYYERKKLKKGAEVSRQLYEALCPCGTAQIIEDTCLNEKDKGIVSCEYYECPENKVDCRESFFEIEGLIKVGSIESLKKASNKIFNSLECFKKILEYDREDGSAIEGMKEAIEVVWVDLIIFVAKGISDNRREFDCNKILEYSQFIVKKIDLELSDKELFDLTFEDMKSYGEIFDHLVDEEAIFKRWLIIYNAIADYLYNCAEEISH